MQHCHHCIIYSVLTLLACFPILGFVTTFELIFVCKTKGKNSPVCQSPNSDCFPLYGMKISELYCTCQVLYQIVSRLISLCFIYQKTLLNILVWLQVGACFSFVAAWILYKLSCKMLHFLLCSQFHARAELSLVLNSNNSFPACTFQRQ